MHNPLFLLMLGLLAGTLSGLVGLGGGFVLVPALVFLLGFNQHLAQGTTLAIMVPPIGLLAAWVYYKQGAVDLYAAVFVCLGFFVGGLIGAKAAVNLPAEALRKIFGVVLLAASVKMIIGK